MPSRRSVIIIELAGYGRRICVDGLGSSYDVFFFSALEFLPALVRDFFKGFYPISLGHCVAESLTAVPTHVVHADRCDGLHSQIDSGGTDHKSAAAADADDADAVSVHKRASAQKVHGGTEIFDERFWRSYGPRLPAALAIVGGIESQGYESPFRHLLGIQTRRLFLHATEWMPNDDRRRFLRSINAFRDVQIADQVNAKSVVK